MIQILNKSTKQVIKTTSKRYAKTLLANSNKFELLKEAKRDTAKETKNDATSPKLAAETVEDVTAIVGDDTRKTVLKAADERIIKLTKND